MKLWMAPAGLHIEPASQDHVGPMARLHGASFFQGWSETEFAAYVSTPHATPAYVACDGGRKLAGFMVLRLAGEECELLSIVVDRKWRRKGVGRALLEAGMQDVAAMGAAVMFLEVARDNRAALALYERYGFRQVGVRSGYYPEKQGSRTAALVMRRDFN